MKGEKYAFSLDGIDYYFEEYDDFKGTAKTSILKFRASEHVMIEAEVSFKKRPNIFRRLFRTIKTKQNGTEKF
jgi:hypothetical protein